MSFGSLQYVVLLLNIFHIICYVGFHVLLKIFPNSIICFKYRIEICFSLVSVLRVIS